MTSHAHSITTRSAASRSTVQPLSHAARSVELAMRAAQGAFSVVFVSLEVGTDGQPSRVDVLAPSASVPFLRHAVTVDIRAGRASCDCPAATFGRPCRHAGSAILYAVEVVKAYREAEADYRAAMRAEDRAAALRPSL